jgi:hypothetical protein
LERLEHALRERFGAENVYKDLTTNKIGEPWIGDWADAYANADVTLILAEMLYCPQICMLSKIGCGDVSSDVMKHPAGL